MRKRLKTSVLTVLTVCMAGLAGGCAADYMSREDRISMSAGDAIAVNKAIHVVDPWPSEGFNTRPRTMGQRVVTPVQRYRDGTAQAPGGSAPAPSSPSSGSSGGSLVAASSGITTGH